MSNNTSNGNTDYKLKFLKLLANRFPTIEQACSEIINLSAIINLPKGTEHFLSDVHGEYESFIHVLRNASGVIRRKISDVFPDMDEKEQNSLAFLIYYPRKKLQKFKTDGQVKNLRDFYETTIRRVVAVLRKVALKYTRSKVRKAFPSQYAYIIEELISEKEDQGDGSREIVQLQRQMVENYYQSVIDTIIDTGLADQYIEVMCDAIQRLSVDRLHVVGDIYDRGPGAEVIIEELMKHHAADIQFGNHDIVWMAAATGHAASIANNVRTAVRYANLETLEAYAISLDPVAELAKKYYADDPCKMFQPKKPPKTMTKEQVSLMAKMQKAIAVIQEKLDSKIVREHPEFGMENRLCLSAVNWENYTIEIEGKTYELNDRFFPTVDPKNPEELNEDEKQVMEKLIRSHVNSEKLHRHVRWLFEHGSLYLLCNGNLLTHALIPMESDPENPEELRFSSVTLGGKQYSGRALFDKLEQLCRQEYDDPSNPESKDICYWMWKGPQSPLFGKHRMATFERYWIDDQSTWVEEDNPYFKSRKANSVEMAEMVLKEFGLDPSTGHIISGHMPVKVKKGERPVKCAGKIIVIDGGFANAYQGETGIAGYTLISNSYGLLLTTHDHFNGLEEAINSEVDLPSKMEPLEKATERQIIRNTDIGKNLVQEIEDLKLLVECYRNGTIKQRFE